MQKFLLFNFDVCCLNATPCLLDILASQRVPSGVSQAWIRHPGSSHQLGENQAIMERNELCLFYRWHHLEPVCASPPPPLTPLLPGRQGDADAPAVDVSRFVTVTLWSSVSCSRTGCLFAWTRWNLVLGWAQKKHNGGNVSETPTHHHDVTHK